MQLHYSFPSQMTAAVNKMQNCEWKLGLRDYFLAFFGKKEEGTKKNQNRTRLFFLARTYLVDQIAKITTHINILMSAIKYTKLLLFFDKKGKNKGKIKYE